MDSKYATVGLSCILLLMMTGFGSSDLAKDREECADQLIGLATCLPYVGGEAKAPTIDCCTGLKQVLGKNMKCLCILVRDRNDPNLGLKINATLALGLPSSCHTPVNISDCTTLLHLAPNSPDAKVFQEFANSVKGSNSTTPAVTGNSTSNGSTANEINRASGRGKRWLGVDMVCGVVLLLWCFTSHLIFDIV